MSQKLKNIDNIAKEAQAILDSLEGKQFTAEYVFNRFEKAANAHSTDQLIGNMKNVIEKVASKRAYITSKEIGKLYNEMYGLSGGHTAFRDCLEDLLPQELQFAKTASTSSKIRTMDERKVEPIYKDSELSNAFSVLFSVGSNSAFSTTKPHDNKAVEKVVYSKLKSIGYTPIGLDIMHSNDHFTLCSASFNTSKINKVSVLIPVQTTDGVPKEPTLLISDEKTINLDARNLYSCIRSQERDLQNNSQRKVAMGRNDGKPQIEIDKLVVPTSLEKFADLENTLIAAGNNYNANQISMAIEMVGVELRNFGARNPSIKIASSDKTGITFTAFIPTKLGKSAITIPVEIHNGTPTLPSKFASKHSDSTSVYTFSKDGFESFARDLSLESKSLDIARDSGEMSKMSYHQLVDKMLDGVASKDYKLSEDALSLIESKFGGELFATALENYSQLLKHSSNGNKRKELIKKAYERGELIKIPTSVELYCPKLGLLESKISFDENERIIPLRRKAKYDNQIQETLISTSKIVLT